VRQQELRNEIKDAELRVDEKRQEKKRHSEVWALRCSTAYGGKMAAQLHPVTVPSGSNMADLWDNHTSHIHQISSRYE